MPWYKLLAGKHTESKDVDGTPIVYKQGDVFESKHDLVAKHNREGAVKFELVDRPRSADRQQQQAQQRLFGSPTVDPNDPAAKGVQAQTQPGQPPVPAVPPGVQAQTQPAAKPVQNLAEYHARLDRMNLRELQEHAKEEEIDLKGAATKADIIKILREPK